MEILEERDHLQGVVEETHPGGEGAGQTVQLVGEGNQPDQHGHRQEHAGQEQPPYSGLSPEAPSSPWVEDDWEDDSK